MSSAHFFSFAVPLGLARSGRWAVAATTTALLSGKGNLLAHRLADAGLSLAGLHFDHAASGE